MNTEKCITDRFHGTIFCLKNQIPFISLEKEAHLPRSQRKIFDLLSDFDLTSCYADPQDDNFTISGFLNHAHEVETNWESEFRPSLPAKLEAMRARHLDFVGRLKTELGKG